jgi:hypothetical protein
MARNPFRPTFGVTPPLLVGRDDLIDDFQIALDGGPGDPHRATLLTGTRGVGKTSLVNALETTAKSNGWLVISETANDTLNTRLLREWLPRLLSEHVDDATRTHLTSLGVLGVSATWNTNDRYPAEAGLRTLITSLLDTVENHESGLLITIDELRPDVLGLDELTQTLQHLYRENREIMFVGAGLPDPVAALIERPGVTFLQRADRAHLDRIGVDDVTIAIQGPIGYAGRTISDDALEAAVVATDGYPFMIQLVGYYSWNQRDRVGAITLEDVANGARQAQHRIGSLVHAPALKGLSPVALNYLLAMAVDDGPSSTAAVAGRLQTNTNYGNQYRSQLIRAEIITATSHGYVDFTLPGMREYLREHDADIRTKATRSH